MKYDQLQYRSGRSGWWGVVGVGAGEKGRGWHKLERGFSLGFGPLDVPWARGDVVARDGETSATDVPRSPTEQETSQGP